MEHLHTQMKLQKAQTNDLEEIMKIVADAQRFMGAQGLTQWQDGYPGIEQMRADIAQGICHILRIDGKVAAIASIAQSGEPTYDIIYEGRWRSDGKYAAVHRVAISDDFRGMGLSSALFKLVLDYCKKQGFDCVRIDTHRDNKIMQKVILGSGFAYCGIIYLEDGNERFAYDTNELQSRQ